MYVTSISEMKIATKNGTRHILQTLLCQRASHEQDVANGRSDGAADLGIARLTVRQPELDLVTANAAVYLEKGGNSDSQQHDDNDGQQDF